MKEKLWFYLALDDDSEQQKNIDLEYSTLWMLLLGGALILTAIYFLLNRFYWLEAWVKNAFHGMIGLAIVAAFGVLGLTYSGCGAEAESATVPAELPAVENKQPSTKVKASASEDVAVVPAVNSVSSSAGSNLKSRIQGIIDSKVKPALNSYNSQRAAATSKSAERKVKRKIVNMEAVELLLSTRIGYIEDAEKQARDGNLSSEAFENRIAELAESVDSLVNKYKLK